MKRTSAYLFGLILLFSLLTSGQSLASLEKLSLEKYSIVNSGELWKEVEKKYSIEISMEEKAQLLRQLSELLPLLKFYQDKDSIKVGHSEFEIVLSQINAIKKSFHINGMLVRLDHKKNLKWNIKQVIQKIELKKHSSLLLDFIFAPAHAVVKKGLLIIAAIVVLALVGNQMDNYWKLRKLKKSLLLCQEASTLEKRDIIKLKKRYDGLSKKVRYKRMDDGFAAGKHCVSLVDDIVPKHYDGTTTLEFNAECRAFYQLRKCVQKLFEKDKKKSDPAQVERLRELKKVVPNSD